MYTCPDVCVYVRPHYSQCVYMYGYIIMMSTLKNGIDVFAKQEARLIVMHRAWNIYLPTYLSIYLSLFYLSRV